MYNYGQDIYSDLIDFLKEASGNTHYLFTSSNYIALVKYQKLYYLAQYRHCACITKVIAHSHFI